MRRPEVDARCLPFFLGLYFYFEIWSLLNVELDSCQCWSLSPRHLPHLLYLPVLKIHVSATAPDFQTLKSGPLACAVSALSTEPSPQIYLCSSKFPLFLSYFMYMSVAYLCMSVCHVLPGV